jgi:hypothetical protein
LLDDDFLHPLIDWFVSHGIASGSILQLVYATMGGGVKP